MQTAHKGNSTVKMDFRPFFARKRLLYDVMLEADDLEALSF
jgi:hypothetical protein